MKPTKTIIPVERALAEWRDPTMLYQVKEDGCFEEREMAGALIAGERLSSGEFIAFDLLAINSSFLDLASAPLTHRWPMLKRIALPPGCRLVESAPNGADLLQRVLARGGEGVVAKRWDDPFGPMLAAKRSQNFLCRISAFNGGANSVKIEDAATGDPRGNVPLRAGKIEQVRVGSVLKVVGMLETRSGKIREPRLCSDAPNSWLAAF